MRILHDLADLARKAPRVSLAAGTFDGVHRGHQRVLTAAVARARALGGKAWALTFEPHPHAVLRPAEAPAILTPPNLRNTFLEELGLDGVVVLPFTPELAALSPEEFVRRHLMHGDWAPEVVFAGEDWRFGAGGAGRLADLPALSGGRIRVRVIPELLDGGAPVSSTRIRAALADGDVATAARLLGRDYLLSGTVERGRGVGRSLDAATANLAVPPGTAIPRPGVYAAVAHGKNVGAMDFETAVVNIGVRPTFHDAESGRQTIEAHIIGYSGNLYGKSLCLQFLARLRDERAFDSPEALAAQIQRDIEAAEAAFDRAPGGSPGGCSPEALRAALAESCRAGTVPPLATVLQAGRNTTILVPGAAPDGGDLVVKRFGRPSRLRRILDFLSLRGSKAYRSYEAAAYLTARGIPTPEPLGMLPVGDPAAPGGALATRAVANLRSFHRELVDLYAAQGPCSVLMERLQAIAEFCADMHDAGFLHRDLGDQNLFFAGDPALGRVMTLDLNRGRCLGRPLTLRERARDLSRIDLPSDLLRVFLEMYWRGDVPPRAFLRLERRYRRAFQFHCATRRFRHPIRERRKPPNPEGEFPAPRDIWIWDDRSAQAIPAFRVRDRHRLQQRGRVWQTLVAAVSALCRAVPRKAKRLRAEAFQQPVDDVGGRLTIALSATRSTFDRELALLRELAMSPKSEVQSPKSTTTHAEYPHAESFPGSAGFQPAGKPHAEFAEKSRPGSRRPAQDENLIARTQEACAQGAAASVGNPWNHPCHPCETIAPAAGAAVSVSSVLSVCDSGAAAAGAKRPSILLRLYAHDSREAQTFTLSAAQRLHAEGFGVALALVQCRESVTDPASWDALGRRALAAVAPFVRWVEVGHAVNRVKWGLWGYKDLHTLLAPVAGWRRDYPNVRFVGPAVIDFEPDFTAAALRQEARAAGFAALSQALYVDRRGAPERRQNGHDAVDKLALLGALGESFGVPEPVIVSEFNWPLAGQGVWSPVGSPYVSPGVRRNDPSVTEEQAAAYTMRYLLLGLCSGLASEMVFWRLVARGFGLVDDTDSAAWRRRPAFEALRLWYTRLSGARFERREDAPDGRITLWFRKSEVRSPESEVKTTEMTSDFGLQTSDFSVSWDPSGDDMPTFAP